MAQRFEVSTVNNLQELTGGGADYKQMGLSSFEAAQPATAPKPAPVLDVGGMKL